MENSAKIIAHSIASNIAEFSRQSTDETEFYSKVNSILTAVMDSYDDPIEVIRTFATIVTVREPPIYATKLSCFDRFAREYHSHIRNWDSESLGPTVRYTLDENDK